MGNKLLRWLVFNFLLGLFPLLASLFIHSLAGKMTRAVTVNSPEVLFLALTISGTALRDLYEGSEMLRDSVLYNILYYALFISLLVSAFLYGLFTYDSMINPQVGDMRQALLGYNITLAATSCVCGVLTVLLLHKIGGSNANP